MLLANYKQFGEENVHEAENYKRIGATTQDLLSAGLDLETVPLLHLLKGCDTTSYIYGIGNSTAWSIFKSSHELLKNINCDVPNNIDYDQVERFMCRLYKDKFATSLDSMRVNRILTTNKPEDIPPTSDAYI